MSAKPINNIIKKHFQGLFDKANELAEEDFSENIASKIKGLDHFNQTIIIINELTELKAKVKNSEYPFYIKNHSSDEWLLNQFASRAFLLNIDESEQFIESVRIGLYQSLIFDEESRLKESLPLYTYDKFLNGEIDPYFSSFEYFFNIGEDDYYKIRGWQADKLIKIVSYESRNLIKQIQAHCKTLSDPMAFILSEKEIIESQLTNTSPNGKIIKSILSNLFVFRNFDLDIFDDNLLVENFKSYSSEKLNWFYINPRYINPLIEKLEQKPTGFFSNESSLFFTINKIDYWFDLIIQGRPIQEPVNETNWDKIYKNVNDQALKQVKSLESELDKKVYNSNLSAEEIKKYLVSELECYRYKFNNLEKKYYLGLLDEKFAVILKNIFITNSFFGNEIKEQSEVLKESIIIHELAWTIISLYSEFSDSRDLYSTDRNASYIEIMFLMHQMVLDKELEKGLNECMNDFFNHFHSCVIPLEILFQNHKEKMSGLFTKSLNRLESILDNSEPSNKILFLQSRLKQLNHRELEFKQIDYDTPYKENELTYTKLFKEFLEIEADFIRETKDVIIFPGVASLTTTEAPKQLQSNSITNKKSNNNNSITNNIPASFTYIKYSSNLSGLNDLLTSLKKHNFVAENVDIKDFRKIFNNTIPENLIQWTGNISELSYFVKLLHSNPKLIVDLKKDIWKVTASLFVDENKNPFDWKKFRGQKTPAKAELIENAVNHLK